MLFKKLLQKTLLLKSFPTTSPRALTRHENEKATTRTRQTTRHTRRQTQHDNDGSSDDEQERELQGELDFHFPTKERFAEPILFDTAPQNHGSNFLPYQRTHLRAQPKRLRLENTVEAAQRLREGIRNKLMIRFSPSTWQRRTYLFNTVSHFSTLMHLTLCENTILLALEWISASVTAGTLLSYATTLRAMYPAHGGETLDAYIQSLRKLSAKAPIRQAPPLTREQFYTLMLLLPDEVKWALWVAWKTASRWGETRLLSAKNISFTDSADEVVIDFKELTKGSSTRPFRMDMIVLLKDTPQRVQEFRTHVARIRNAPLTQWTTTQLTASLRKLFPGSDLSAHSPKRGAMQIVMEAAANGLIPLHLAAQIAKHLGGQLTLPDTTVRYITDRVALARANGSGAVTALIK